jgi:hypothetical protein
MFFFFDETGCNTNQKKDGNNGGEKFVCGRGTTPKQKVSTRDKHFTVLGVTAATGEPVLCVVIFASDKEGVSANWATGMDITVDPEQDEFGKIDINDEKNFGKDKYFPSGPTCNFRGKKIPYLPLSSPSGSITGELLVAILSYIDFLEIYERVPGGPVPFLLVDGHDSRLSPVFVDYITNPDHPWQVNLGIPYATSYWQVGDSSEQNGYFKMLLNLAKRRLVSFKLKHNIPICLTGEDIVPLINAAWDKSFGNVKTNKKAIAVRGWNPLNKNLLLHKEICSGTNSSETLESTNTIDETDTNTERVADTNTERVAETNSETTDFIRNLPELLSSALGVSGDTFGKIVQHVLINGGIERNKENLARGENIQDNLQNAKRLTSGVMVKHGVHEVNNPTVQMLIKDNRDRANFAEKKSLKKKRKSMQSSN